MARLKHTNPETFTSGEISHGTGISVRNIQLLRDNNLIPDASDRNQWVPTHLYDLEGLMHFAMLGALQMSGLALIHAAKIIKELKWEFNDYQFGYMSGLKRNRFNTPQDFSTPDNEMFDFDFWFHNALRQSNSEGYVVGRAWENDIILVLADREYALLDIHKRTHKVKKAYGDGHTIEAGPDPFCQIIETADQTKPSVIPVYQRQEWKNPDGQLRILDEYYSALNNATGISRVNLSLAIRNCADRIHDLRIEKGGKIFALTN